MVDFLVIALVVALFGTSTFLRKIAVDGMSPYHLQVLAAIVYTSLVPLWIKLSPEWTGPPPARSITAGVGAILGNVIGSVIFGFLLKKTSSPAMLAVAASTSPVVTAVLTYMFLNETFTMKKILGVACVLTGMVLFHT